MVTYPLEFPSELYVNSLGVSQRNAIARSESSFTFTEQVYDFGGEAWVIEGGFPLMTRDSMAAYRSFMTKLKGKKGTFLFPMFESTPRGVATGTPLVDGAGQTGDSVDVKGFTPSTTGIMKAADWIQFGTGISTRLHMVLDDADSDGSGNATLNIWPSLRSSPADEAAVTVSDCKGLFRLSGDVGVEVDVNKLYTVQAFSAMEALNGS